MALSARDFSSGDEGTALEAVKARGDVSAVQTSSKRCQYIVPALTLTNRNGEFAEAMMKDHLAFLSEGGVDGVLVLGTTGEFPSFSIAERKQILESNVRHKGRLYVIAGIGTTNLAETLDLLAHAQGVGADSVLVVPPFYYKSPSLQGLTSYYARILEAARIPVLLYNIPQMSGVTISHELIVQLSVYDHLYGIKDSSGKWESAQGYITKFPKLCTFVGKDVLISEALKLGAGGAITSLGNIFPKFGSQIVHQFATGKDVSALQQRATAASTTLGEYSPIAAMKFYLGRIGLRESYPRPPLSELTAEQKKTLMADLAPFNGS